APGGLTSRLRRPARLIAATQRAKPGRSLESQRMKPEFDLAVIGGGAGGLAVAAGGAKLGAKVALIEKDWLGGENLWLGSVPSKTLRKSARVAYMMRHADRFALAPA